MSVTFLIFIRRPDAIQIYPKFKYNKILQNIIYKAAFFLTTLKKVFLSEHILVTSLTRPEKVYK